MRILNPALDLDRFFARLRHAPEPALLLDFDGTLAPFRSDRDRVHMYDGVGALLARILAGGRGRVALVSGRSAGDLAAHLEHPARPEIWGSHGIERLAPDGTLWRAPLPPAALAALGDESARLLASADSERFEIKPYGIAVHVRGCEPAAAERLLADTRARWSLLARTDGLRLREFDGGIELDVAAADKGRVVETIFAELGPGALVAALGDDRTDEDAFRAIRGRGLAVLVRPELRDTAADLWIEPPQELLGFLARWAAAITEERSCD